MRNIIFLFFSFFSFSQVNNQNFIEGTVYNDNSYSIEGVHVLNITSNEATITDSDGNFKIFVNLNDELIFSAIQFKRKKIIMDKGVFDSLSINVYLEEFVNELDEVILNSSGLSGSLMNDLKNSGIVDNVNFDDLGIPGFTGIRKEDLPSNSQLTKELLLAPLTGTLDVERMYNWISGYYKKKEKRVSIKMITTLLIELLISTV
jgi:hypothetical protein